MQTYTIKKLEWKYRKKDHEWVASPGDGVEYAVFVTARLYKWYFKDGFQGESPTMEEAKAAAQAHYERLVRKHLEEVGT